MKELALNTSATSSPVSSLPAKTSSPPIQSSPTLSSSQKPITPAVRTEPPTRVSRWMERREKRATLEKERTHASNLVEGTSRMTGNDIEIFED